MRNFLLFTMGAVLAASPACTSDTETGGGNAFSVQFFEPEKPDPLGEAVDCTPLSFAPHNPAPQCLFGPPAQVATPGEIADGDYHLTSFQGPACNTPWIDAAMRVQRLADGRLFIKERRSSMVVPPPGGTADLLDASFFIDPKAALSRPKSAFACREVNAYVPTEFTVIDSYLDSGKPTVVVRVQEFYVLVYTHD